MKEILDSYNRRARLQPALLAILPLGLAAFAWAPADAQQWGIVWGVIVSAGGTALLSQMARDRGKIREARLFRSWGGKPTTRALRSRQTENQVLLARRHKKLQDLLPEVIIPTLQEEKNDPRRADEVYETCVAFLVEKTRDRKRFPLIFEESCNYGFRRNLWGLKPIGILCSFLGVGSAIWLTSLQGIQGVAVTGAPVLSGAMSLFLLLGWLFWFRSGWVRLAADAYAERLIAACEELEVPKT
jgi:hypothetical protein